VGEDDAICLIIHLKCGSLSIHINILIKPKGLINQVTKKQQKTVSINNYRVILGYLTKVGGVSWWDFEKLKDSSHKEGPEAVDHTSHAKRAKPDSRYVEFLNDGKVKKSLGRQGGISAKLVHKVEHEEGHDTYMIKPYHKKIESKTRTYVKHPILGWATMANRNLYKAGGIGHLCEDVSVHEHDGLPMTVHKFAKGLSETMRGHDLSKLPHNKAMACALQAKQIAIMDFLSNNLDRHGGNLLYGDGKFLAIDHERSFQYHGSQSLNNISSYVSQNTALKSALYNEKYSFKDDWGDKLSTWWDKNGGKIKSAFEKELKHIKDETIREHVEANFMKRWGYVDDMVRNSYTDLFYSHAPMVSVVPPKKRPPAEELNIAKFIESLAGKSPTETIAALDRAYTIFYKRRKTIPVKLENAWAKALSQLSPEDTVKYLSGDMNSGPENKYVLAMDYIVKHRRKDVMRELLSADKVKPLWKTQMREVLNDEA